MKRPRSKTLATWLAVIGGAFGAHRFYLHGWRDLIAWLYPLPTLGRLSLYNRLLPGRLRLPYGDEPSKAYNLSLYNLEAMFSSHQIGAAKPPDEYRVILIGDSSTWGFLLPADQTTIS